MKTNTLEINKRIEEKVRANTIREMKKKHPKGFCYICGKGVATIHHLKELKLYKKNKVKFKKVTGEIPLCRDCHDYVEQIKQGRLNIKRAKIQAHKQAKKEVLEIINNNIEKYEKIRAGQYDEAIIFHVGELNGIKKQIENDLEK